MKCEDTNSITDESSSIGICYCLKEQPWRNRAVNFHGSHLSSEAENLITSLRKAVNLCVKGITSSVNRSGFLEIRQEEKQ